MNYAYLFAGIAIGFIAPWIFLITLTRKKTEITAEAIERANRPNELLSERNQIGEREARALTGINASLALMSNDAIPRRERIATEALNGYLAGRSVDAMDPSDGHHRNIAKACLRYADALIIELDEKGESDLQRLIESLPPRVARVVSGHELKQIVTAYNTLPPTEPVAPLSKDELRAAMEGMLTEVRKTP